MGQPFAILFQSQKFHMPVSSLLINQPDIQKFQVEKCGEIILMNRHSDNMFIFEFQPDTINLQTDYK
jgi:hypothetical protein